MPPTEYSFLKHARTVREALETFLLTRKRGPPCVIYCAMVEVINFAVGIANFYSFGSGLLIFI
jgi:hypothetical protein